MADEPSNGELGRRLDEIRIIVQGLVGRAEYAADQRALEHRLTGIERDIEEGRGRHSKDMQQVAANRLSWRAIFYTGILPAVLVLLGVLVQIWLAKGHG
ncbi:MAG: hypothetical protein ACRDND_03795 [Streptosporangiaceae bacterium]